MNNISTFSYTKETALSRLPHRPKNSNKGTFGKVCVIGGTVNMSGAAYFAAKAAYRTGAGLVNIVTPEENRIIYQTQIPEAVLSTYNRESFDPEEIRDAVDSASVVVIGMGLGLNDLSLKILRTTLKACRVPLVIDADALRLMATYPELWHTLNEDVPVTVTPHPGEMSALCGMQIPQILEGASNVALSFSRLHKNCITVLKTSSTVVSDGNDVIYQNNTGNSGMSTGGSGDVLAGMIGALIAQQCDPFTASTLGVYFHGLAGDFASNQKNEYSVMASDIIESIPYVLK